MCVHRNVQLLGWFNFFLDLRFFAAILVIFFAQVSGSYALALSVLSITMLSAGLLELPTGVISDAVGRKAVLVCGAAARVVAMALYASATSYLPLACGGVAEGLSRACFSGNNQALLYDSLAEDQQQVAFAAHLGRISAMSQAALAACALLGSLIAANQSLRLVMWLSVLPQVVVLGISVCVSEPRRTRAHPRSMRLHLGTALRLFWISRRMRLVGGWSMTGYALGEAGFQFTPVFVNSLWPLWALGIWSTLAHLGGFVGYRWSGRVVRHGREVRLVLVGKIIGALCDFPALLVPTGLSPLLLSLTSLVYGPTNVAVETLLQREFSDAQRATLGSISSLGGNVLFGITSVLLGLVADRAGARAGLLLIQTLSLGRIWFLWQLRRSAVRAYDRR